MYSTCYRPITAAKDVGRSPAVSRLRKYKVSYTSYICYIYLSRCANHMFYFYCIGANRLINYYIHINYVVLILTFIFIGAKHCILNYCCSHTNFHNFYIISSFIIILCAQILTYIIIILCVCAIFYKL